MNILVNDSFEGVLSNFGLSRVVEGAGSTEGLTDSLGTNGTIRWMARELIHDEPGAPTAAGPTLSSDIWALGCTFYEARQISYHLPTIADITTVTAWDDPILIS